MLCPYIQNRYIQYWSTILLVLFLCRMSRYNSTIQFFIIFYLGSIFKTNCYKIHVHLRFSMTLLFSIVDTLYNEYKCCTIFFYFWWRDISDLRLTFLLKCFTISLWLEFSNMFLNGVNLWTITLQVLLLFWL